MGQGLIAPPRGSGQLHEGGKGRGVAGQPAHRVGGAPQQVVERRRMLQAAGRQGLDVPLSMARGVKELRWVEPRGSSQPHQLPMGGPRAVERVTRCGRPMHPSDRAAYVLVPAAQCHLLGSQGRQWAAMRLWWALQQQAQGQRLEAESHQRHPGAADLFQPVQPTAGRMLGQGESGECVAHTHPPSRDRASQ
jgi:hypothetical protein